VLGSGLKHLGESRLSLMRQRRRSPEALVRRYSWTLYGRVAAAHTLFIGILGVYAWLFIPVWDPAAPGGRLIVQTLPLGLAFVALVHVHGYLFVRAQWRRWMKWIPELRSPTVDELGGLYAMPRRFASFPLAYWAIGLGWTFPFFIYVLRFRPGPLPYVKTAITFVFLAFVAWSLSYLLVERALRPIVAHAMTSSPAVDAPKTMSMVRRLLLAWAATAAVPIASVPVVLTAIDNTTLGRARTGLFVVCIGGGLSGLVVAAFSGRAIADPIRRVRDAMRHIETGDLTAEISVEETAELGDLEIGFNRMAAGLRERERLRDVFGRHVGAEVARRAMETEFGSGGERCVATAMFVDIIGSTGLTQRRDPEAVVAILNRFFDAVVRVVATEGGLVNKFQGDGALCLFGTPLPVDDHAARALRAARALAAELAPMGDVAAAIGVSSGEVVAGNVGAADRYEYTVIGDAVNEAARLTELAKLTKTHVLVSERTILAADAEDDGWEPGETVQLRGRSEPTLTYAPATSS